ncbi:hypothetical protein [Streptomyces silvisoli]|uniref:Uncharacterized protein n=1 Tax=Streptomyces silvisoli TaxID=3034235 RepID=A0ABT5ZR69_9ACTN|nr:hypothetical protein [Streptomyces silvisoli]MDF3291563.1 hypothetical protein [Streptomyces silvisoli]
MDARHSSIEDQVEAIGQLMAELGYKAVTLPVVTASAFVELGTTKRDTRPTYLASTMVPAPPQVG